MKFRREKKNMRKSAVSKSTSALRLKNTRKGLGYTQDEFSEILGMTVSGYKKIESGENRISTAILQLLWEKFQVSADYLLFGESVKEKDVLCQIMNCSDEVKLELYTRLKQYFVESKEIKVFLKQ